MNFFTYLAENSDKLIELTLEHIGITFLSLFIAILIAIPSGILATRYEKLAPPLLGVAGILQTIPSIALLGFLLPVLGIGLKPAIVALFLYALLPIVRNTYTGIQEVDPAVREAAKGMGLTGWQILRKVELPLALPVIFAGLRTATVINVGIATLAAYIGAGGLGEYIFGGIALNNNQMILAGAVPAALLAILLDQVLGILQRIPANRLMRVSGGAMLAVPVFAFFYFLPSFFTSGLRAGFEPEFAGRDDGYPGLQEKYGFNFNTVMLSSALMYKAVKEGEVDIIAGYSTDGRIKAYNLALLEDDRNAFPPYYCVPILNQDTDRRYPELRAALQLLSGKINDSIMTELNYEVDFNKTSPEKVARDFLESLDLYRPDRNQGGEVIRIGSKIFTEQYILAELFAQLINGYTDLDTEVKPGLGGTKICFEATKNGEIDLYPEYTGTGFLVILSPDQQTRDQLLADADAVYHYVKREFAANHNINWLEPLGFQNSYILMMRRREVERLGIQKTSDLTDI